ncbi:neuronal acetylcholine receptor subunit alpha-3-like [Pecten maximus]|uniref:neuronal acetylcholine receptor subunit alpha-3-like n=1 Tax=Pecten maximus TaxID=6579 RepID=UPI0014583561|nr:neuronal acetylcholine receptor subunit alpha-3-like [Pecten maximus]
MTSAHTFLALLRLVLFVQVTFAQTGTDLKALFEELFNTRAYNKNASPHVKLSDPITINIAFFLQGINYLDEVEEKLATTANLKLEWKDAFLSWDKKHFNNISYFYVSQDEVWKPDISLNNGFTKLTGLGDKVILVKVDNHGEILWNPQEVFETKCDIDITKFPFDRQSCNLVFVMWAHSPQDVSLALKESPLHTDLYEQNGVWDLYSSSIKLDKGNIVISLTLDRNSNFYILTTICPIILLSFLDIFTFVIPVESGEKIGYSMTVHLAFAVLLTIVSSSLPVNSRTASYLAVYVISLLIKGTAIVMVTVIQVRLHHRPDNIELSPTFRYIVKINRRINACSRKKVQPKTDNTRNDIFSLDSSPHVTMVKKHPESPRLQSDAHCDSESDGNDMYTWSNVSAALDGFFFCFFTAVDVILVSVFFKALL